MQQWTHFNLSPQHQPQHPLLAKSPRLNRDNASWRSSVFDVLCPFVNSRAQNSRLFINERLSTAALHQKVADTGAGLTKKTGRKPKAISKRWQTAEFSADRKV
jgi:hypothetical protein